MQVSRIKEFMSSLLKKVIKPKFWLLSLMLVSFISCKKEVIQVNVDAFEKIDPQVESTKGVYALRFSLPDYPYQEVGVRLSAVKSLFWQTEGLNKQVAVEIAANKYAVYYNTLVAETTYYYQLYVVDPASAKTVYSDVYSFTTSK
jgi:hypothetical protein